MKDKIEIKDNALETVTGGAGNTDACEQAFHNCTNPESASGLPATILDSENFPSPEIDTTK